MQVKPGLAAFASAGYRQAASLIAENHTPEMLEWTADQIGFRIPPAQDMATLQDYARRHSLIGHGVDYSVLSPAGETENKRWLQKLAHDPLLDSYGAFSVHFGFSRGWRVRSGAPLPLPLTECFLAPALVNMEELARILPCRLGLENLALSFSRRDTDSQGEFLERLLEPFDGYLLLDLHNLYCQSVNFGLDLMELAGSYPLHRVEEIHVSGGSWSEHEGKRLRRDTHDDRVPDEVLAALPGLMARCPRLQHVILEQLPQNLKTPQEQAGYAADFYRLCEYLHVAEAI